MLLKLSFFAGADLDCITCMIHNYDMIHYFEEQDWRLYSSIKKNIPRSYNDGCTICRK